MYNDEAIEAEVDLVSEDDRLNDLWHIPHVARADVQRWICLSLTGPTQDMNSLREVEYFTLFFSEPSFIRIISEMHENAVTKIAEHPDQN